MEAIQHADETTAVDLGTLLDDGDDAVVSLVAGDTRLVVHRAVLVDRSPVFCAMFANDTVEASSGQVTIADVEGPVLRQLLSYLYTLRVPQLTDNAAQLLAAAETYGLAGLKAACEQQVAAQLSVADPPAETSAPAPADRGTPACPTTQPRRRRRRHRRTPATAAPATAASHHTPPPDNATVSRLRSLPAEEKGEMLICAAIEGAVGELEALLAAGADMAPADTCEMTALHYAALCGHVEVARLLVARGAPVDARNSKEETPVYLAAWAGHAAVVQLLLAASADHSARNCDGYTPLHWAADKGDTQMVAALLEAGADRGARNNKGETPLLFAKEENHYQVVKLLTRT